MVSNLFSVNQLDKFRQEIIAQIPEEEDRALIPELPPTGDLNIEDIMKSDFFFA